MLLETVQDHLRPSLRSIPYSFHYVFQTLKESPCTFLFLNCHEERHSSYPIGVSLDQNELPYQEQLELYSSLLLEQMFLYSQFHNLSGSLCKQFGFIFCLVSYISL